MIPIKSKYSNRTLQPTGKEYSDNVIGIDPLPVWTDGEQCVSCWKMSFRERLSALLFGRVWLALLSGETQPPASLSVAKDYLGISCPTYNYWHDLRTDLRKPASWLDLANMVLRRFRLVLVKTVDGDKTTWRLRLWLDFLDDLHEQGRCEACSG